MALSQSPQLSSPLIDDSSAGAASLDADAATGPGSLVDMSSAGGSRLEGVVVEASSRKRGSWKLKYYDIMPASGHGKRSVAVPSDNFQNLVDKANEWLRKNPDVAVRTCETLTWMDADTKKLGESENVIQTKKCSATASTHYLRGLRLWYVPRSGSAAAKQLCYADYAPVDSADTVLSLVNRANRKTDSGTFKGHILSLETVSVPILHGSIDTGVTSWAEAGGEDSPQAFVLRVFYNKDDAYHEHIGIKDFVPCPSEDGYEGFESLIERANTWFKDQADLRLTNLQSLMVQRDDGPHSETGSACFYTMPGLNSDHPVEFFRILRLAYTRPSGDIGNGSLSDLPIVYPFTYENFTPELVPSKDARRGERIERMKEMFSRVGKFLQTSGADLICAETVMNPMQLITDDSAQQNVDEIKWLFTLRVYTTNQVVAGANHHNHLLDPELGTRTNSFSGTKRSSARKKSVKKAPPEEDEEEEGKHPGPIFLGNVVTQQYRYRWMVAAISVFVTMTIIVVVSVVYSNQ